MANRLNGSGSLNYMGVNAPQPPNLITMSRRPTVTDGVGFALGTIWLIPQAAAGITPQQEVWQLVGNRQNIFTWKHLRGSGGSSIPFAVNTTVYSTPGSYTYTPTNGLINVTVECVGGGGGTSSYRMQTAAIISGTVTGQPGGGGAYCKRTFTSTEIGASQPFVVGQGGQSPAVTCTVNTAASFFCVNTAHDGGDSTFGSFMTAGGGKGETASYPFAGVGGIATGGDINANGQNGLLIGASYSNGPRIVSQLGNIGYSDLNGYVMLSAVYDNMGNSSFSTGFGGNAGLSYGLGASTVNTTLVPFSVALDGGYYPGVNGGSYGGGANATYGTIGVNSSHAYDVPGAVGGNGVVIITEYF